jgi:hypothetical protein
MEIVVADVDGIDIIIVAPKRGSAALLPVKSSASFQGPTAPTGQGPGLQLPAFPYKWGGEGSRTRLDISQGSRVPWRVAP